ncbi:protein-L-isoaspartate O-methyltransferase family protein [Thiomicrospira sp. S5]|uniref:protein-L-isoaspartate O-methyltransferase family protein n=1 Tax=Thiomicrospira sp. S5 TaxID=1803865 RepID=UPI000F8A0347|nr:protein-L-isoaspartate O-methyltransferase [Thiomicrospira sp. S5]AZR81704.1 protein-L-isoaspartate O-methyltransferase [Thiomicrospira sp. S5]
MNFEQARFNMVEQQIRPWDVLDPKILDLFMSTPRHEFVAESQQALAYSDIELPIGEDQSMLPPRVEARLLQALDPAEDETVLEIGTGSGYTTALLAKAAKSVTTVELFPSLQETAQQRLTKFDNITFKQGDASQGWDDEQTYDVIFLTGAVAELPDSYKQQLNLGGRLVAIQGEKPTMTAEVLTRISDTEWETEVLFETVLPYLVHAEPKSHFSL